MVFHNKLPSRLLGRLCNVPASSALSRHRFLGLNTVRMSSSASQPILLDHPIEEETLPSYHTHSFHPTHPGQVLNDKYKTITKLGFGAASTVWLAEDLKWDEDSSETAPYVSIKIAARSNSSAGAVSRELEISKLIATADPSNPAIKFLRIPIDNFQIEVPHGPHTCLVYELMRETPEIPVQDTSEILGREFSQVLFVHLATNTRLPPHIKENNIMLGVESVETVSDFVDMYKQNPTPRHVAENGAVTYLSDSDFGPLRDLLVIPHLTDFDLARPGQPPDSQFHIDPAVQPPRYRAPEVILGTGWTFSADIWNLGQVAWTMTENKYLFDGGLTGEDGQYDAHRHLGRMISRLGPPPPTLVQRERLCREQMTFDQPVLNPQGKPCMTVSDYYNGPFFDKNGKFIRMDLVQPQCSLRDSIIMLEGEEKEQFLDFIGGMLAWEPQRRKTARQLLRHPWIQSLEGLKENFSGPMGMSSD